MSDMDFYEDDEPVDRIRAAFESGVKRVTGEAILSNYQYLGVPGLTLTPASPNEPTGELIAL